MEGTAAMMGTRKAISGSGEDVQYEKVPKWIVGLCAGTLTILCTALIGWAVNVDGVQRELQRDVSTLKEFKENVNEKLQRIETKLDRLLESRLPQ